MMMSMLVLMGLGITAAKADIDTAITPDRLPKEAQHFLATHFPNEAVSMAKRERDLWEVRYEVVLANSTKLEFRSNGQWEEVDCRYKEVPVSILPTVLLEAIQRRYANAKVLEINRDRRDYEVRLNNGLELTFDLHGNLIDIDD